VTNPFINRSFQFQQRRGRYFCKFAQAIKCLIVGVTLVPMRVLLSFFTFPLGILLARLATVGLAHEDFDPLLGEPLAAWRLCICAPIRCLARFQLFLFGFHCIRFKGTRAPRSVAPILVANHVSGLVEGLVFQGLARMVEESYARNFLLAPFLIITSCIFVDRTDAKSRDVAKSALLRRTSDPRWPQTLVFPEGACTNGSALIQFKLGAFNPGVPVQPVVFRYSFWWHDPSFTFPLTALNYVCGLLFQVWNRLEVEFLPVHVPSAAEISDASLFASSVQCKMSAALRVPTTKHASEDVALIINAQRLALPAEAGIVRWQALSEHLTQLRVSEASQVLRQFRELDIHGHGRLSLSGFTKAMRGRLNAVADAEGPQAMLCEKDLQSIFNLLDTAGDGYVDFAEYLCSVAVLNGRGQQEEIAAFKWVFDSLAHMRSHLKREEFHGMMLRVIPSLTRQQRDDLFLDADLDGNGVISRNEFLAFVARHKEDLRLKPTHFLRGLPADMSLDPQRV